MIQGFSNHNASKESLPGVDSLVSLMHFALIGLG